MRNLLLSSAVIVIVAVAAPNLFTRYMDGSRATLLRRPAREAVAETNRHAPAPGQVEIEAARDGHFYVDAEINLRPVRLIVDTGATVVALRQSDAATAGIRPGPGEFVHPVQTANGTTNAATAVLDSITVADIEVRHVRALIIPDDKLGISLLGGSFLHGLQSFEVTDGTLVFEGRAHGEGFQPRQPPIELATPR
jgi:aspartyl protease family protein